MTAPLLIDTHCHLYAPPLGDDVEAVLAAAHAAGVTDLVVPGVDRPSSQVAIALAEAHPGRDAEPAVWAAVGHHPEAVGERPFDAPGLAALLAHPRVVAVGEIGLDRSPGRPPFDEQLAVFEAQLALATDHNLPTLIHSRDASGRVLEVLRGLGPGGAGGLLHAWAGSAEVARELHALGYRFGVGGVVSRPQATRIRRMIAALPLDWLLLETDAPYIGTVTRPKGQVGPADLPEICDALAALREQPAGEVARVTSDGARTLLRLA